MSTSSRRANKRTRTETESSTPVLSQTNTEFIVHPPEESTTTESTSSVQSTQIHPTIDSNFIFQQWFSRTGDFLETNKFNLSDSGSIYVSRTLALEEIEKTNTQAAVILDFAKDEHW